MVTQKSNRNGLEAARLWLDESTASLDSETITALNKARIQAAQMSKRTHAKLWWLGSAGSIAASALVAVLWWSTEPSGKPLDVDVLIALETGNDSEVADDMMFLLWLEENNASS